MDRVTSATKSLIVRAAGIKVVRKVVSQRCAGLATVFLLHRAAGVYPGVNGHDPDHLDRMLMKLKKEGVPLVSVPQIVEAARGGRTLPPQAVAFTIDDGYRDQIDVLAPVFVKHGVPVTVFVATGLINKELWSWDAKIAWLIHHARQSRLEMDRGPVRLAWPLGSAPERLRSRRELQAICAGLPGEEVDQFLYDLQAASGIELPRLAPVEFSHATWNDIRRLEREGVLFAPHSHTHRILSRLKESEVRDELCHSLQVVMEETSNALPVLAYPAGKQQSFGLREMKLAQSVGFVAGFAVDDDYAKWQASRDGAHLLYRLGRIPLPHREADALWLVTGLEAVASTISLRREGPCRRPAKRRSWRYETKRYLQWLVGKLRVASGQFDSLRNLEGRRVSRLVFVCRGNICRSPYAEAVARSLGFAAVSCGVNASYGDSADVMAVRVALSRGHDLSRHVSQRLSEIALDYSDCIVAMEETDLDAARPLVDSAGCQSTLLGLWRRAAVPKIEDPYGKGDDVFHCCFDKVDEALVGLARFLQEGRGVTGPVEETPRTAE